MDQKINPYPQYLVWVNVIIQDEQGRVLIGQRTKKESAFFGLFEMPGGKLEKTDKSLKAAAIREVQEETNLKVSKLKHISTKYYPKTSGRKYGGIAVCFKAGKVTGSIVDIENSGLTYMETGAALDLKLVPWVAYGLKKFIKKQKVK